MLRTSKRLLRASWRRAYSAQSSPANPYPFHNVRAYPFKMSPERAVNLLSPTASLLATRQALESLLCFFFPSSGLFSPIKPVRLQPIYFPGWFLDVELQGQVEIKGSNKPASAQIRYAYIPGSDYKVLSSACLAPVEPEPEATVPFSDDLLRQHDLDIACIPYNISPFSTLDIAGHLSYAESTIEPNFRLIPSTLKADLFAAYPVLLPLYLAQYETKSGELHTVLIEAHDTRGNVWSERFSGELKAAEKAFTKMLDSIGLSPQTSQDIIYLGYPKQFVEAAEFSLAPHQTLGKSLHKYTEDAINLPGAATTLAAASAHDFDQLANDRRIRGFTPEERDPVLKWLSLGSEIAMVRRMHEALSLAGNASSLSSGKNTQIVDKTLDTLLDKSQTLQAERLKVKPHWAKTPEELDGESPGGA